MIEFLSLHFIEILLILGFNIGIFAFKIYKDKKSPMAFSILILSIITIIIDGLLKFSIIDTSKLTLLFYTNLINVYLFCLIVLPISLLSHIALFVPLFVSIVLGFFIDPILPVLTIISVSYFVITLIYSICTFFDKEKRMETITNLLFSLVNIITCYLQAKYYTHLLINELILLSTITVFLIHYVREYSYKKVLEEKKIQTQRTSIAISQIQPHFLYNSLATIGYICKKDSEKASEAIDKFSDYLRANLNSLKTETNIPFKEELKHVETYLWLEKLRFDDRLEIIYDINVDNFLVPPLSIQPLVENAVKHGICEKIEGGTLYIRTIDYNDYIKIIIEDTGAGFDMKAKPNDGRKHVGIENVKSRIESMANGELVIRSEIGKGTISTITLPKEIK